MASGGRGEKMAGQAALMASTSVRAVAPLACSSSSFVKPGANSDANRCGEWEGSGRDGAGIY